MMKIRQALKLYGKSKHTLLNFRSFMDYDFVIDGNRMLFDSKYELGGRYYKPINNPTAKNRVLKYLSKNPNVAYIVDDGTSSRFSVQIKADSIRNIYVDNLPKIGDKIASYDDGKIRESREEFVTITDIIPFDQIDDGVRKIWEAEYNYHYWNTADTTDYFIKTVNVNGETIYFARDIYGGWFSIGNDWLSGTGLLDTTGKYYNMVHNNN